MEKNPETGSGMNFPDLIFENLVPVSVFGLKILKFFDVDPDLGSCRPWIRDPGWKKSDPGFWILDQCLLPISLMFFPVLRIRIRYPVPF
jgi:hypothetical protein